MLVRKNILLTVLVLLSIVANASSYTNTTDDLREGQDYALFFAVNDYKYMDELKNPIQNARDIATELQNNFGFQTEVIENPTLKNINDKLDEYLGKFKKGTFDQKGQLLIYFSGHGIYQRSNGYFMPKDGNPDSPNSSAIEYDYYRSLIDEIACQHIMVAIDACHSATFDPDYSRRSSRRFKRPGEEELDRIIANHENYKARVFWTSDGLGDQTPDRSQFAYKLLEGLCSEVNNTGYLKSSVLYSSYLEAAVPPTGGGRFGNDEPSSCFLFFKADYDANANPEEEKLWRMVNQQNTLEAYAFYLQTYSNGKYAQEAGGKKAALLNNNTPLTSTSNTSSAPDNFVRIEGGTFQMGDTFGEGDDDETVHSVTVSTFYMNKYEVTVSDFSAFVDATNYKTDAETGGGSYIWKNKGWQKIVGINWRHDESGNKREQNEFNHPVIHISWCDAVAYANWLSERNGLQKVYNGDCENITANWNANGYRLPTEAEWEYAARESGRKVRFGNGEDVLRPSEANFFSLEKYKEAYSEVGPYRAKTVAIGSLKQPNALGLHDMSGNVWEWCWDWYWDWYGTYPTRAQTNPRGASEGSNRVYRGGGWDCNARGCRAADRDGWGLGNTGINLGFRLAHSL